MKTFRSVFWAIWLVALLWPVPTMAQSDTGELRLSTSPLPVNLVTLPCKPVSTDLRVRNAGSQTETLQVGLLKFSADSTTGQPILSNRGKGDNYFDWVSFSPAKLTLTPNQWGTVKMTINVPTSAAFGYYYAVTFGRSTVSAPQPGQASLLGAAATLVLLEAKVPNAKREVQLVDFSTSNPWYEFLPATFNVKLRNTGNVHAAPFGSIFIKQNDQQIDEITFNEARNNILPQSPRTYTVDWSRGFPVYQQEIKDDKVVLDSQGHPSTNLKWDFTQVNHLRFGKYTAHLVLAYDNGKRDVPIEKTIEFWVIPWRFLLGGSVLALFFVFGVAMFGRTIWKNVFSRRSR
jgi:hypothetical protein